MIQENWTEDHPYCIYKHTSPSGKIYIGQTCKKNLNDRWSNGHGYNKCDMFAAAIKKYGWENFKHEILVQGLTKEEADEAEITYIAMAKVMGISYNMRDGGSELTEKDRNQISKSLIGRFVGSKNPFWGKKHPNRGTILIHKGTSNKHIKEEDLDKYVAEGWERGPSEISIQAMSDASKGTIWVKKGTSTKQIFPDELDKYIEDGWVRGRISNERWCKPSTEDKKRKIAEKNKGGIYINNGTVCKHIRKDELDKYMAEGWVKGQLKNPEQFKEKMRNRIFINKDGKQKMVKQEELDKYLSEDWKLGRK